jgi:hypothetical protein
MANLTDAATLKIGAVLWVAGLLVGLVLVLLWL